MCAADHVVRFTGPSPGSCGWAALPQIYQPQKHLTLGLVKLCSVRMYTLGSASFSCIVFDKLSQSSRNGGVDEKLLYNNWWPYSYSITCCEY